jgi:hypothetical protein
MFFFSSYDFFACTCVYVPKNLLPCSQFKNLLPNVVALFQPSQMLLFCFLYCFQLLPNF